MLPSTTVPTRTFRDPAQEKATPDPDRCYVRVGGKEYAGWLDVDLDSDIFTPADSFHLTCELPAAKDLERFAGGEYVEISLGDDRQFSGYIDEPEVSIGRKERRLVIAGRDKGAILYDNEAESFKTKNLTIRQLAEKLVQPWGMSVVVSNDDNRRLLKGKKDKGAKPVSKSWTAKVRGSDKIDPGQKVAAILDDHTRRLGLTWWVTAKGELFIGLPNYDQPKSYDLKCYAAGSKRARENNILDFKMRRPIADRYSEITVKGQGRPSGKSFFGSSSSPPKWTATVFDAELQRRGITRKLVVVDNDALNQDMVIERAKYEMGVRNLGGLVLNITVEGFRQNGKLWAIDTIARVVVEEAGIDANFYITQRRFREARGQRRTELTLHEPGVWLA